MLCAIDTSTAAITVAIHSADLTGVPRGAQAVRPGPAAASAADGAAGGELLASVGVRDARAAGELLSPLLDQALTEAGVAPRDLTDIVCGIGPGPFTGLRIGIVTARVLALTSGARLHGMCSLDALAGAARRSGWVAQRDSLLVTSDARRREIYWAVYPRGVARAGTPAVGPAADLPQDVRELPVIGAGVRLYPEVWSRPVTPGSSSPLVAGSKELVGEDVDAGVLAQLASDHPELLTGTEPWYLRHPDTAPPRPAKKVVL